MSTFFFDQAGTFFLGILDLWELESAKKIVRL